jgi:hypothetical protein
VSHDLSRSWYGRVTVPEETRTVRLPALTVAAVLALAVPAGAATKVRSSDHMYGARYCEYLVVTGTPPNLTGTVWNTYGLNDCPQSRWDAASAADIARDEGALLVLKNGPRYWLMDRAKIWNPGDVRSFRGLRMRELTTFQIPLVDGRPQQTPYSEITVNRKNTFVWGKGRRVYELHAPNGRRYLMQAYSQIVDRTLRRSQLAALGARLQLPAGWTFTTRRLRADLRLHTDGAATVLQDELQNTYQRLR